MYVYMCLCAIVYVKEEAAAQFELYVCVFASSCVLSCA